jgi:hypothetical protein
MIASLAREQLGEFDRLGGLGGGARKWLTGTYLFGTRLCDAAEVAGFARRLARLGIAKMLRVELILPTAGYWSGCGGTGLSPSTRHGLCMRNSSSCCRCWPRFCPAVQRAP